MSYLTKKRNTYYARIRFSQQGLPPRDEYIPLYAMNETEALARKLEVDRHEKNIKKGIPISFPWQNEEGTTKVEAKTLGDTIDEYIEARKHDGLRSNTIDIYTEALTELKTVAGQSIPVDNISIQTIDKFKSDYSGLAVASRNMHLRAIKTFLIWCEDRKYLKERPKITMVQGEKRDPIYLSNDEYKSICSEVSEYVRSVFHFYRETGCRLSEPFLGTINGEFLTVTEDNAKGHHSRDIWLTKDLKQLLEKMRAKTIMVRRKDLPPDHSSDVKQFHYKYYSKQFTKACSDIGLEDRKFHSLRHTAALRLYLRTGDIYRVSRQLGHISINTTQIYTKFDLKKLQQDFPDIVPSIKNMG